VHFSNFMVQRGTIMQFIAAGAAGIEVPMAFMPEVPMLMGGFNIALVIADAP